MAQTRAEGMAGAYVAVAAGPQAPAWNPANLALPDADDHDARGPDVRGIELFALHGSIGNDCYSLSDYRRFNGAYWGEAEKQEILGRIESSSIQAAATADLSTASVALGEWAFTTTTHATWQLSLPKEYVRLALYGNTVGETFDLDGAEGAALAYSEFRLSAARRLDDLLAGIAPSVGRWATGASLKLLEGWAYAEILEASGGVTTTAEEISGSGELRSLTARGGHGFACDLGLAGPLGGNWRASLAVRDLAGQIIWKRSVEERIDTFDVVGLTLDEIDEETVERETRVIPRRSAVTRLPTRYALGVAHQGARVLSSFALSFASDDAYGATRALRASAGVEWQPLGFLALRGGASVGGVEEMSVALGGGFAWERMRLDLAVHSWGTVNLFASRGLGAGLGLGLVL